MSRPNATAVGLPLGLPAAAVRKGRDLPRAGAAEGFAGTKDCRQGSAGLRRPERRRGQAAAGLNDLLARLSTRDLRLLDTLAVHRFLTTAQLQAFVFQAHASDLSAARTCRRVLRRLETW